MRRKSVIINADVNTDVYVIKHKDDTNAIRGLVADVVIDVSQDGDDDRKVIYECQASRRMTRSVYHNIEALAIRVHSFDEGRPK